MSCFACLLHSYYFYCCATDPFKICKMKYCKSSWRICVYNIISAKHQLDTIFRSSKVSIAPPGKDLSVLSGWFDLTVPVKNDLSYINS